MFRENSPHNLNPAYDELHLEPYIGPRPYSTDIKDQLRFFGRDTETDEIIAQITSHRIVLVYAQSGAGKTSLFNAKIIPSLRDYGLEVLPIARVKTTSTIPMSHNKSNNDTFLQIKNIYIYNALQILLPKMDPESILDLSLFEFLDKYFPTHRDKNGEIQTQVLIFDQLEELFNLYPDSWIEQQKGFFEQIADSLENNPFLRIVVIIREDFLGQLNPFRNILPEKLKPYFRVEKLRREEAILAMKGPLINIIKSLNEEEKENIESEINELLDDLLKIYVESPSGDLRHLQGEFIEPIQLQVVCKRWWHERSMSKKTRLEDLGNVDKALEDFYEDAISSAYKQTGVREKEIRYWCQDKLITSSGTRSIIHRGPNSTGGIDNRVVDILERKYLVRREWRSGASWYEITHDRLIKPIKDSNKKWFDKNLKSKRALRIKIFIPIALISVVTMAVFLSLYQINVQNELEKKSQVIENQQIVLRNPTDISINSLTDDVYIVNSGNNNIQKYDSKGKLILVWGSNGTKPKEFNFPRGISIDSSNGDIYVADTGNNRIQKYDSKGNLILVWGSNGTGYGEFNNPTSVSIDSSNGALYRDVYVADTGNNRIQKYNSNGTLLAAWGAEGSDAGEFNFPSGIATDTSGNVYVADTDNNRIQKFTSNGKFIVEWGAKGSDDGELHFPSGISIDSSNDALYVADSGNNRIQKFDSNGNFITKWGVFGSRDGQFTNPTGISIDSSNGDVYVADTGNNRIQKFDSKGIFLRMVLYRSFA